MTRSEIGNLGESLVVSEFSRLGVPVFRPIGDGCTADLVAEFGGQLHRVQVKTSAKSERTIAFPLARPTSHGWEAYPDGEIDWYAMVSLTHNHIALIRPDYSKRWVRLRYIPGEHDSLLSIPAEAVTLMSVVREYEERNRKE